MTHQLCSILDHISRHEMLLGRSDFEQGMFLQLSQPSWEWQTKAFFQQHSKQLSLEGNLPFLNKQLLATDWPQLCLGDNYGILFGLSVV